MPNPTNPRALAGALHAAFRRPQSRRRLGVFVVSLALHATVLAVLAALFLPVEFREEVYSVVMPGDESGPVDAAFDSVVMPETLDDRGAVDPVDPVDPIEPPAPALAGPYSPEPAAEPASEAADGPAAAFPRLADATSGRGGDAKEALLKRFGGTAASEAAVAGGLKWLASVQRADGGWSFREVGGAGNPGTVPPGTEMGATACALLAFLGAGHTHEKAGPYRDAVRRGVDYLVKGGKIAAGGGDFRGDVPSGSTAGMYIQGLVAISLAETYAMTKDRRLKRPAEAAVRFIVSAQDPARGGWRYEPRRDGDTSVVGWQLMALKSAQAAGLRTPPRVYADAGRFLDSVAADGGARYGYTEPQADRPSTTAVGLLCRMYLGWGRDVPALKAGVGYLAATGPDFNDLYYGYYATQVLHHWGGDEWKAWNAAMRDGLVARQVKAGPGAGSWNPGGSHAGQAGGRLFETCLAVMTLEVYYRHLPLYERDRLKIEF